MEGRASTCNRDRGWGPAGLGAAESGEGLGCQAAVVSYLDIPNTVMVDAGKWLGGRT